MTWNREKMSENITLNSVMGFLDQEAYNHPSGRELSTTP